MRPLRGVARPPWVVGPRRRECRQRAAGFGRSVWVAGPQGNSCLQRHQIWSVLVVFVLARVGVRLVLVLEPLDERFTSTPREGCCARQTAPWQATVQVDLWLSELSLGWFGVASMLIRMESEKLRAAGANRKAAWAKPK